MARAIHPGPGRNWGRNHHLNPVDVAELQLPPIPVDRVLRGLMQDPEVFEPPVYDSIAALEPRFREVWG